MIRLRTAAIALIAVIATAFIAPGSATAAERPTKDRIVTVTHGPITPSGVQGTGLGTVRYFTIPATFDSKAAGSGYLIGTLTTIGLVPDENRDVRASNLVFVNGNESNQLVVGGISIYPADGSTLAPGTKTVRPIVGGSGLYNGARGYVVSTNLGADGWSHVFHLKR